MNVLRNELTNVPRNVLRNVLTNVHFSNLYIYNAVPYKKLNNTQTRMIRIDQMYLREDGIEGLLELILLNLFIEIVDVDGVVWRNTRLRIHRHGLLELRTELVSKEDSQ